MKLDARLERYRVLDGYYASQKSEDFGAFYVWGPCGRELKVISSGADHEYGWEHVSVSGEKCPPNWEEMCFIKNLFWDEEEAVMQLHPKKSDYVNCHPNCLHLWKPLRAIIPLPPAILVGPKANVDR